MRRPTLTCYVPEALVKENAFIKLEKQRESLPSYQEILKHLPVPQWEGHEDFIACYWKAWELAFDHLRQASDNNDFIANYIDTAFNNDIFMWDTVFILMYAKYGRRAFDFFRTLDNFYAKQHPDGFICRQIWEDGSDAFHRHDPSSTGPNVFPWAEWEYYQTTGNKSRLEKAFPVLLAFHRWMRAYRTWPDGTYWSSGWGCGMDNLPRLPKGMYDDFYHGHQTWVDTTIQQVFAANTLLEIAQVLGRSEEVGDLVEEREHLSKVITTELWSDSDGFFYDRRQDGTLSDFMFIGSYWALLAGLVSEARLDQFLGHLSDKDKFNRPHRIPAMTFGHPMYDGAGDIWVGGVWTPTNYMVLRGLTQCHRDDLAHEIAINHVANVVEVFKETGTIWEYYAPERPAPGKNHARPNMVGWGGLPPIAVLFEYIIGIRPQHFTHVINSTPGMSPETTPLEFTWDVRLLEEHGISNYPLGESGTADFHCRRRNSTSERPEVTIKSDIPLNVTIKWTDGSEVKSVI